MSRHKRFGILVTAAALLLGVAGSGLAKPVLQEDFRGSVNGLVGAGRIVAKGDGFGYQGPGNEGPASYVRYSLKDLGFNPREGTLEFDMTRGEKHGDPQEGLVSFDNEAGRSRVALWVGWDADPMNEGRRLPAFLLMAKDTANGVHLQTPTVDGWGNKLNIPGVYVKKNIHRGQSVHVALTWGPGSLNIYVDGVRLEGGILGLPEFMERLAETKSLVIGATTTNRDARGAQGMSSSLIANVQLHNTQLKPSQFDQPIASPVPVVFSINHDAFKAAGFSGKLVAGNHLQVTMTGTTGAAASFDLVHLSDLDGKIELDWKGFGVYLENKNFFADDEINLRFVDGYRVYVSKSPINLQAPGIEPVEPLLLDVKVQSYTLKDLDKESPYYVAVLAEMRDRSLRTVMASPMALPLTETSPGVYNGSYTVGSKDHYPKAVVVGHLGGSGGVASLADPNQLTIDATLNIAVEASPAELLADEKSTSEVTVTVTDANNNPVSGHKINFVLATTSQYTGVVGGGAFTEQVGGSIKDEVEGETDIFGKVTTTYVAGFAAKTAIVVARDMISNDTGAGAVKTFIQASVQIEQEPVNINAMMGSGFEIVVTSSDEWLTADGKSQAKITARVTRGGQPAVGHSVDFAVSGVGSIRTVKDKTDRNGEARAVYTAGKKIGNVYITATDTTAGISGSVMIELRSDAPAKIAITVTPEKIPADGHSHADVLVLVTDINDNPNENTEVEYYLVEGGGRLRDDKGLTDRRGECTSEYVAGRTPGKATIQITVRSTVPTEEEFGKARDLALAVTDYKFF